MSSSYVSRLLACRKKRLYRCRRLRPAKPVDVDFTSNDYLGLSQHSAVIKAFQAAAKDYGVGSGGSVLVSGYTVAHQECEAAFAEFLGRDRALLFSSGYMANLGVIDAMLRRGDRVYMDRHNHASLLDGARLSFGSLIRYAHGNCQALAIALDQSPAEQGLVVTDGVFSMYGDVAPLSDLVSLAKRKRFMLMVDDAHGIGVLGEKGRGSLECFNLTQRDVPILVCPLGKALGVAGAIVAGDSDFIECLIQFARSYIYTTALAPALAKAAVASLEVLQKEAWRRAKLRHLIAFFRQAARARSINFLDSETAIQSLPISDASSAMHLSHALQSQGYRVQAMRPPSVPESQSILRITLNVRQTESQVESLLDAIS